MGVRQSHLNIHLLYKTGKYGQQGYEVTLSKEVVKDCKSFEVYTHTIEYKSGNGTNFDIYIYNNKRPYTTDSYVFAYCSPSGKNQVVKAVKVYFSVFIPDVPLVISFYTNGAQTHNCLPSVLKKAGWDYGAYITRQSFIEELSKELPKLYKQASSNWKIQFFAKHDVESTISEQKEDLDNEGNYKRYIYKPSIEKATMSSKELFKSFTTSAFKNQIDYSYLSIVNEKTFDGILIYTYINIALVLEFIDPCQKIHIQRKDKDATYWAKEELEYTEDKSLTENLNKIQSESSSNNIVTFMLDKFDKYNDVEVTHNKDSHTTYTKYTHKSKVENKPNLVFKGVKVTIVKQPFENKTKSLDVYYLKVRGGIDGKQDGKPFLIIFNETGEGKENKTTIYHFNNTEQFNDWIEFKDDKSEKLEQKLEEIESSRGCGVDLFLLRKLAFEILIREERPTPPAPPPEEKPKRPPIYVPPTTEPANLSLIIGCSVGGFLLLVALVVGYGIYWYNTTIKLLT
ncbi:hypothetical protein TOT_010000662 [Theileria orientalis strain Shintoku]|uniref:Uncharacterized protein n=1 Tax=Theileria orientalis strain Shintoku TaxID=869250 RepID=J4CCD5_THEOR|nr:hypothetical protein TOT_010000662 [Theileria orientalis strain Shintoku]BAM39202.1 hypothetical protein TOT_010000662 [Theileria orientalis strain Shintoku]|eukprot:XP_009689503.1 hypothetical protein TOT_010000662 [Theileria orientalis strain Shintoku]